MSNTATINGSKFNYTSTTVFAVQVGRGRSSYKTEMSWKDGNYPRAINYYRTVVVENGFKKRLVMIDSGKPTVVASELS